MARRNGSRGRPSNRAALFTLPTRFGSTEPKAAPAERNGGERVKGSPRSRRLLRTVLAEVASNGGKVVPPRLSGRSQSEPSGGGYGPNGATPPPGTRSSKGQDSGASVAVGLQLWRTPRRRYRLPDLRENMPFLHRVLLVSLLLVVCFGRQLVAQPERLALAKAIASDLQASGVRLERPHVVL